MSDVNSDSIDADGFFNEMEDTNGSTNLRKLADVWMSKNRCCQGHRNRSASVAMSLTVGIPSENFKWFGVRYELFHLLGFEF